ncbi:MAG: hypothetical protein KF911_06665 [Pseudomonadales bacterium]|nr:hypothetical protein [Pseudomonadales bacterium]
MTGSTMNVVTARAPGKVVLWGEYAVLAGAPAMVMAVDRYAACTIEPVLEHDATPGAQASGWVFTSLGFRSAPACLTLEALCSGSPPPVDSPAFTAWHVVHALGSETLPESARVQVDTRGFYQGDEKLGIGSSAAVCVALYLAFCSLTGRTPAFDTVAAIHHGLQGNRGSGIDIAAAWYGGLLRFQRAPTGSPDPSITRSSLPVGMASAFIWTGHASSTTRHLARFAEWQAHGRVAELDALVEASAALFEPTDWWDRLAHYALCLKSLDRAADLGIYGLAHAELDRLAARAGVVYKPCGAGGGDIGAVFAPDATALAAFVENARLKGFARIMLETASDGFQLGR